MREGPPSLAEKILAVFLLMLLICVVITLGMSAYNVLLWWLL